MGRVKTRKEETMAEDTRELTKAEFAEEMRQDAYEERAMEMEDAKKDWKLDNDYFFFKEVYEMEFDEAISALEVLVQLHRKHGHEFDIKELEDEFGV